MTTTVVAETERERLAVCAHALASAAPAGMFSLVLTLIAVANLTLVPVAAPDAIGAIVLHIGVLVMGLMVQWLAFRVRFDAALFADLSARAQHNALDLQRFDGAMVALNLMLPTRAGRDIDARCRGALRLLRVEGYLVVAQAASLACAGMAMLGPTFE